MRRICCRRLSSVGGHFFGDTFLDAFSRRSLSRELYPDFPYIAPTKAVHASLSCFDIVEEIIEIPVTSLFL